MKLSDLNPFARPSYACRLCPRQCGGRRSLKKGEGRCGMGLSPVVARAALHRWEEPCISGTRGTGAVFFSGCVLQCAYCQNYKISTGRWGRTVQVDDLRRMYRDLISQGAHSISLISGAQFLPAVAASLEPPLPVPVVWNTGGYETVKALRVLEGKVQVYLPDLKYADPALAGRLSGAEDYFPVATAAILEMVRQVGPCRFDGEGLLTRGVLLRHLVLPGNLENTFAVLDWYHENLQDKGVPLSLMAQYVPCGRAEEDPDLCRPLTEEEYRRATEYALTLGIEDGYFQDPGAASTAYIPPFDLEGV